MSIINKQLLAQSYSHNVNNNIPVAVPETIKQKQIVFMILASGSQWYSRINIILSGKTAIFAIIEQ